jgi:hypothetical protein
MNSRLLAVGAAMICCLQLLSGCGGGGGGTSAAPPSSNQPQTTPPVVTIKAESGASAGEAGTALQASMGSTIVLASASTAGAGATISSYQWNLSSKPDGSQATIGNATAATASLGPDMPGTYSLQLKVTDSFGQSATQAISIAVSATPPTAAIVTKVVFDNSSTVKPMQSVALGAVVTFDASGVVTAADDAVAMSWVFTAVPNTSIATLIDSGTSARFSPDVAGEYRVRVRASHANGDYVEATYVFMAAPAPTSVMVARGTTSGGATYPAYVGYSIVLDGSGSSVPAGHGYQISWTSFTKPASSIATLYSYGGSFANFVADVEGAYTVTMTVTDLVTGLASDFTTTVNAVLGPTAVVTGEVSPVPQVVAPTFVSSPGAPVTLRGSGSYEPGGAALTFSWSVVSRPPTSTLTIGTPTTADITFTPDVIGAYVLRLTVQDPQHHSSERTATINVGAYTPLAIVDRAQAGVLLGGTTQVSGQLSYDPNGLPLTYQWSVDSQPAGSAATIASPTASTLTFTPDVAGTYSVTLTVSNGSITSSAAVTINAFSASSGTIPLSYVPLQVAYSPITGKAVIVSTNPNALHIVDPVAATDTDVPLPNGVKSLALSPDGTLAAVLHEGVLSLVDLQTATLVRSSATNGSQTMVVLSNAGIAYMLGQSSGQWVTPGIYVMDAHTGIFQTVDPNLGYAISYGTMNGIYSDVTNKIFVASSGLSPTQTYSFNLDSSGNVTGTSGSPYWGNYPMGTPFWLSGDQSLLFTAAGTYFKTSDISYVGTFGLGVPIQSMSHSSVTQEAAVLPKVLDSGYYYGNQTQYPAAYKRFTGSLLFPAPDVPLPMVGGQQSYGLNIFHTSTGAHVMVVQTGTSQVNGNGALYFLILR